MLVNFQCRSSIDDTQVDDAFLKHKALQEFDVKVDGWMGWKNRAPLKIEFRFLRPRIQRMKVYSTTIQWHH